MYDRILLPVAGDEDDRSLDAVVARAVDLAGRFDATLVVLSVADSQVIAPLAERSPVAQERRERRGQEAIEEAADRIEREAAERDLDLEVETVVGHGSIHATIVEKAETLACDLVVMATHGRTGIAHGLLGSVTERVIRTSEVPVLTVPWEAEA